MRVNVRPTSAMKLSLAPYWNVSGEDGLACQGSMRSPEEAGGDAGDLFLDLVLLETPCHSRHARNDRPDGIPVGPEREGHITSIFPPQLGIQHRHRAVGGNLVPLGIGGIVFKRAQRGGFRDESLKRRVALFLERGRQTTPGITTTKNIRVHLRVRLSRCRASHGAFRAQSEFAGKHLSRAIFRLDYNTTVIASLAPRCLRL